MKMIFLMLCFLSISAGVVMGQTSGKGAPGPPNFTGEWIIDLSRSKPDDLTVAMVESSSSPGMTITIRQHWPVITIEEISTFDNAKLKDPFPAGGHQLNAYYADGRGEQDPIDLSKERFKSVAKIIDGKLSITFYSHDNYRKEEVDSTLEYSLADGGNTLIRVSDAVLLKKTKRLQGDRVKGNVDSYLVFKRVTR